VTTAPARHLVTLGPGDIADRLSEALQVYVAAMGYPPSTARQRRALWLDHVRRPGWRAAGWLDDRGALVGVGYGYSGGPGQWWYEEVRRGLRDAPAEERDWLLDYFELTELHVRPDTQGAGLGEGLLRALLTDVQEPRVLLSTPEYGLRSPGRAWRLYRRLGFRDVLRDHRFTGDSRPFAVLGATLPLAPPQVR
jgi:GNAT superfamily N-acetyltransferase